MFGKWLRHSIQFTHLGAELLFSQWFMPFFKVENLVDMTTREQSGKSYSWAILWEASRESLAMTLTETQTPSRASLIVSCHFFNTLFLGSPFLMGFTIQWRCLIGNVTTLLKWEGWTFSRPHPSLAAAQEYKIPEVTEYQWRFCLLYFILFLLF